MTQDWISLKEAGALLKCHQETLRKRAEDGSFKSFPELVRIRRGSGARPRIFMLRSQILDWIQKIEAAATRPVRIPEPIREAALAAHVPPETIDRLRRQGASKTLRALGVKI
jgi:hypothetical protein